MADGSALGSVTGGADAEVVPDAARGGEASEELAEIALPLNAVKRIVRSAAPGTRFSREAFAGLHRIAQAFVCFATDRALHEAKVDAEKARKTTKGKAAQQTVRRTVGAEHVMRFLAVEIPPIAKKMATLFPDLMPADFKPSGVKLLEQLQEQERAAKAAAAAAAALGNVGAAAPTTLMNSWANMPLQERPPESVADMSTDPSAAGVAAPLAKVEEGCEVPQLPLNRPTKQQQAGSSKESGPAAADSSAPVPERRPVTLFSAFAAGSRAAKEEAAGETLASSAPTFPPEGADSLPETQPGLIPETQPGLIDTMMDMQPTPAVQELGETQHSQQQQQPLERPGKRLRERRGSNAAPQEAAGEESAKKKSKSAPSLVNFFGKRPAATGGEEAEAVLADALNALDEVNSVPATMEEAAAATGAKDERMLTQEGQLPDDAQPVLEFPLTQLLEASQFL